MLTKGDGTNQGRVRRLGLVPSVQGRAQDNSLLDYKTITVNVHDAMTHHY